MAAFSRSPDAFLMTARVLLSLLVGRAWFDAFQRSGQGFPSVLVWLESVCQIKDELVEAPKAFFSW